MAEPTSSLFPGPGRQPELKVFSGATFALLSTQPAYPAIYRGGVFVSAAKARPGQPANPGPPGAPVGLDFTVLGGNVALRWSPPTTGGAPTNYRVDVGSDRGLSNLVQINVGNVTGYLATAPAGVFFVRVVATNAWGESPPSNEVVIVAGPALGTGAFSATLSWDTQTDIDLHVIEPSGYHIFFRNDRQEGTHLAPRRGQHNGIRPREHLHGSARRQWDLPSVRGALCRPRPTE